MLELDQKNRSELGAQNRKKNTAYRIYLVTFSNLCHICKLLFDSSAVASASSDADVDDLMASLGQMSVNQRECPGVFECQLKIFEKWYTKWAREDQLVFVDALKKNDPEFQTVLGYI